MRKEKGIDLHQIKRLILKALFHDDVLMSMWVLKGGNALDLIYKLESRSSMDLDLSIPDDFTNPVMIKQRLEKALAEVLIPVGLHPFDIEMEEAPEPKGFRVDDCWGGYLIKFKLIEIDLADRCRGNLEQLRKQALPLGKKHTLPFKIDVSKHEYCGGKTPVSFDDYTIYVYTLEMLLYEKLRAICQQLPVYSDIIPGARRRARARDFYDIHCIREKLNVKVDQSGADLCALIFKAKKVPLEFINQIGQTYEYHVQDFSAVQTTIPPGKALKEFRYYFDSVIGICDELKPFWNI